LYLKTYFHNTTIRTSLKRRRTICFSKSNETDDAVMKLFFHHGNHPHHKFRITILRVELLNEPRLVASQRRAALPEFNSILTLRRRASSHSGHAGAGVE
jgi:hypothetical protein